VSFITLEEVVEVLRKTADKLEANRPVEFNLSIYKKKHATGLELELWWRETSEAEEIESA